MSEAVRVSILELLQELLDSSEVREKPYSHSMKWVTWKCGKPSGKVLWA